jgi:hypothetical protein
MIPEAIQLIIIVVFFVVLALGLFWVCQKFFPEFPMARWICGALLLILILLFASGQVHMPFYHTGP